MTATADILVVDDDTKLADMLRSYLSRQGFSVRHAANGADGLQQLQQHAPDAVLLDLTLPDMDGLDWCQEVRVTSDVPILMLTARGATTDRVVGLELGADDYLAKPFEPPELVARVKALLRRAHVQRHASVDADTLAQHPRNQTIQHGPVELDAGARVVRVRGQEVSLTGHQFDLLQVLVERAGRVQSRDALMQAVRGTSLEAFDRSIDVHISRIRAVIEENPRKPRWIRSIRGVGYVMATASADEDS